MKTDNENENWSESPITLQSSSKLCRRLGGDAGCGGAGLRFER